MIEIVANTTTPCTVGRSKFVIEVSAVCPKPRQSEHRLREDRADEGAADVHAEHRHDRQQAVAEHMSG